MTPEKDEDFAALLAEFEQREGGARRGPAVRVGDTVQGRVMMVGREGVFVEIDGSHVEGMLEPDDVRDDDGRMLVEVGDRIEARVVETSGKGTVVLRRSFGRGPDAQHELEQAYQVGAPVEGKVSGVNKGGLEVALHGVRAFCPLSQIDVRRVEDPTPLVGQTLRFRITKWENDPRGTNVVLSRRALLEEEGQARAAETRARLTVGAVVTGVVSGLKDYGAFVDIGGIEGMLHVSELGHQRVGHPSEVLSVGQQVEVQILKIEKREDPKQPEKISLSLKALMRDPWQDAVERFHEGLTVKGKVVRVESFGAFVELQPGIDGLVHIRQLAPDRQVRHAREVVKPGQELDVIVLSIDRDRRRISLGMGNREDALDAEDLAAAQRVSAPQKLGSFGDLLKKKLK